MKKSFYPPILVFAYLLFQLPAFSQPFTLLKDINFGSNNICLSVKPQPLNLTELNGQLFFTIQGNTSPNGLWKSDGTNAGTARIKEILTEESIASLTKVNDVLFFSVFNANTGIRELWKSDGTLTGSILVKSWPNYVSITNPVPANGILYFTINAGAAIELWKSDGTDAGTVVLKSFSAIQNLTDVDGTLFFSANEEVPPYRYNLWKSNGTPAGTELVKDIYAGSGSTSFGDFYKGNGILYFVGNDGVNGSELWKSDGTDAGTMMIKDIETGTGGSNIRRFATLNSNTYFFANTAATGNSLWKTDGTDAGTVIVKDLNDNGGPDYLTLVGNILFFRGFDDINGAELWKSDGTGAGTVLVKDIFPGVGDGYPVNLFNANGALYFSASNEAKLPGDFIECFNTGGELWKSDGTEAGTLLVKEIYKGNGGGGGPEGFTVVNGIVFFKANNGLVGRELWKTDGTANGTVLVKDIVPTGGSDPKHFTAMNGLVYFVAFNQDNGPAFAKGKEVYQTDGTLSGTNQSTSIYSLGGGSPREIINHNGVLFISAHNGSHGYELWKSDGLGMFNGGTTTWVKDINPNLGSGERGSNPSHFTSVNQLLFFSATDGTNGYELWKSDGTSDGTVMVKNINPGAGDSNPANLLNINGVLYFTADNGTDGIELWKSDGTDAGTAMIKNISPGGNSSSPASLINISGVLYFSAEDGINGNELWKSDGTDAGTVMVKDINAALNSSSPASLANINGVLYFSADDGANGVEIWKSDGTSAGTVLVKDIFSGTGSSNPSLFTLVNGVTAFAADDGIAGRELWRSDGTALGTVLVKDILAGSPGSNPTVLKKVGENVLFAANDGVRGNEVWLSNGAAQGTRMMSEIVPGVNGSDPTEIFEFGAKVMVAATNAMVGSEVWIADVPAGSPLPLELLEFKGSIVNNDGLLQWKTENEINTSSFIVERSTDGRNFSSIGSVAAANTPGVHYYDLTDANIIAMGVNNIYYRLKQMDIDGRYSYSNIIVLSVDNQQSVVMLYPNPVKNRINMTINISQSEKLQWQLIDNTGRTIKKGDYTLSAGSTAVSIDATSLRAGIYYMQLKGSSLQQVIKIMKQ